MVGSVALTASVLVFILSSFTYAQKCFCPLEESVKVYREPSIVSQSDIVIYKDTRLRGTYVGEWIQIDGETISYALAKHFTTCECLSTENADVGLGNSCGKHVPKRQLAAVALWGTWSDWTCSKTCGTNAVGSRNRDCKVTDTIVDSTQCAGNGTGFKVCDVLPGCDNDWFSDWSLWTDCSKTCEGGIKERMRNCTNDQCVNESEVQTEPCFQNGCQVSWAEWPSWQPCSQTCGSGGLKLRYRQCTDGNHLFSPCPIDLDKPRSSYEIKPCSGPSCDATERSSEWGVWSECELKDNSSTCGTGLSFRFRTCIGSCEIKESLSEYNECYVQCPGRWSDWEQWAECTQMCGNGTQSRSRDCNTTASADGYSELNCTGNKLDSRPCNLYKCPVDGQYTPWSNWSDCSVSCDGGRQHRTRTCDDPAPEYGGDDCTGPASEQRDCATEICPVDGGWSSWDAWSPCSSTCDPGIKIRERRCNSPQVQGAGLPCPGSKQDIGNCTMQKCDIDGGWSDWSSWAVCSCQNDRSRKRQCNNPVPFGNGRDCVGAVIENSTCTHIGTDCPVPGNWADWSAWGRCSVSCGDGQESRLRTCTNPKPSNGGAFCHGEYESNRPCSLSPCAVDGGWSTWGSWGKCSASCENGTYIRTRTCTFPVPAYGGADCSGTGMEPGDCTVNRSCPVDGAWASWSAWSDCSVTCGNGTITRNRSCSNPAPLYGGELCQGAGKETGKCALVHCPVDGLWSDWGGWGGCDATCDGGQRNRKRDCTHPPPAYSGNDCLGSNIDSEYCYIKSCKINGSWSTWEEWTPCSQSCSNGTRERIRLCDDPPPSHGGSYCNGSYTETDQCYKPCPVDGEWATWLPWGACSVTCNNGTSFRTRTCSAPLPQYGGKQCAGTNRDDTTCFPTNCPVDGGWTPWYGWSSCNATCGAGSRKRARLCRNPEPQYGGNYCTGSGRETEACNQGPCPGDTTTAAIATSQPPPAPATISLATTTASPIMTPAATTPSITSTPQPTTPAISDVTVTNFHCYVCDVPGDGLLCASLYSARSCPHPYCVNELVNAATGDKYIQRRCGTHNECEVDWFQGTSDNDRCMNYDENQIYVNKLNCTFCCVNDLCNMPLRPKTDDLYQGTS